MVVGYSEYLGVDMDKQRPEGGLFRDIEADRAPRSTAVRLMCSLAIMHQLDARLRKSYPRLSSDFAALLISTTTLLAAVTARKLKVPAVLAMLNQGVLKNPLIYPCHDAIPRPELGVLPSSFARNPIPDHCFFYRARLQNSSIVREHQWQDPSHIAHDNSA
jgi:hypothetical protein